MTGTASRVCDTSRVLHLQLRVPDALTDEVLALLRTEETVANVAVLPHAYAQPPGTMVVADVAREGANPVVSALRPPALHHPESIMRPEPSATLSDEADRAEEAAPGEPDDGVVW